MNDGDFRIVIQNKTVHRVLPTYQNLNVKLPKIISEQDLIDINRILLPVIDIYGMKYGEFKVVVMNRCVKGEVVPMFDYLYNQTQNKK